MNAFFISTFQYVYITLKNAKVTLFKHVTVTCCILTFQIVTFINVKVIFLKYVMVTQCRNAEITINRD